MSDILFACAFGFMLGVSSFFLAMHFYLCLTVRKLSKSLVDLKPLKAEIPGAVVVNLFKKQSARARKGEGDAA